MFANLRQRPYRVALLGFNEFERASLASCLRLSEQRTPAYEAAVSQASCDFLVADADWPDTVAHIVRERRAGDTVFIGAAPPHDARSWLMRPIEPAHVLRALDALLMARVGAGPATPAAEPAPAPLQAPPKRRPNRATSTASGNGRGRRVLVVDDSRIARAFLAQRLTALGYRVEVAESADEALKKSAAEAFAVVFLDLKLGDHDALGGLQVCRSIKQQAPAPAIVITTASNGESDRVRGSLAGCDAYLTKPLLAADFSAALARVDPLFAGVASE